MRACEFCGEKRDDVKVNDCGVMLCDDCERLYAEEPADYLAALSIEEAEEQQHYRAEGW